MTATKYGNFAVSGWCVGCGRKFTPDGRCPNCDAWWASPLVRVGGPLVVAVTTLLALGIWAFGPRNTPAPVRAGLPAASTVAATFRPARDRRSVPPPPEAPPSAPARAAERAAQDEPRLVSQAEQVRLRLLSAHVDAVIAADDEARAHRPEAAPAAPPQGAAGF